ncbi:hypothetical protein [Exiguobacterium sp. s133]|uniref:hypothetical protein n=1 Tax=Exiguobacterium sp. s133 TaxID=2751213 RepID=UPI001BE98B5F|nr:hypothetical protein [Exiguobacterium sp. s133]
MNFQTPSPFLYQLRDGSMIDPYVDKVETLKQVDGRVVLSELPVKQNGVLVDGYFEIDTNNAKENEFFVDYTYGVLYFFSGFNNTVIVRYKGKGNISLPSDRIYHNKDGNHESLDAYIDGVNRNIDSYNNQLTELRHDVENTSKEIELNLSNRIINSSKLIWKEPVNSFSLLSTTYPSAEEGYTSMARDTGKVYRQNGSTWVEIQDIDPTAINAVETRVTNVEENLKVASSSETAPLGSELLTPAGWTSIGWTGDFTNGFQHVTGNVSPLSYPLAATDGKQYQVVMTVEDTDTLNSGFKFKVTIGNSAPFEMYQAVGSLITYSKGIQSIGSGNLTITPTTDFTGLIKNISVKEIVGIVPATFKIKSSTGENVLEIRPAKKTLNNVFLGNAAGEHNTSGEMNTAIGHGAMENNLSGFWNVAMGYQSLYKNVNGSRNIALGRWSLFENISGARNVAIGSYALHRLTTGDYNVAIGADSGWYTTTGSYNISIGTVSLDKNTTGSYNVAIGYNALRDNTTTSFNVAIGQHALRLSTQNNNTAIGAYALASNLDGAGLTAIGYQALNKSTGSNNTAIGQQVLLNLSSGTGNTAMGRTTLLSLVSGSSNTIIGQDSMRNLTSGQKNTVIGQSSGLLLTTGDNNILVGQSINTPTATTSNYMSLGDLIYGDLINLRVGIGINAPLAKLHIGAGSSTVAPIRINAGTLLTTPANHSIEYDGAFLYLTSSSGIRRKFAMEAV